MGNRAPRYGDEGPPSTLELALFGPDESIGPVYFESLGYENICRFWSDEDVISELIRLSSATI